MKDNLIDFFVPFLPLEYRHVRLCARDAFLSQKLPYTEEDLDQIATMMVYVPQEEKIFSPLYRFPDFQAKGRQEFHFPIQIISQKT